MRWSDGRLARLAQLSTGKTVYLRAAAVCSWATFARGEDCW
jgi:hypothetical protein